MAEKRARVESQTFVDSTLQRRRELTAARVRAHRERQRAGATALLTQAQLQQGEQIVDLTPNQPDIPVTLPQLGLRIQGLTVPQDPDDATQQSNDVVAIDEHRQLYHASVEDEAPVVPAPSTQSSATVHPSNSS